MNHLKTCPVCGIEFETKTRQRVYCSDKCYKQNQKEEQREVARRHRERKKEEIKRKKEIPALVNKAAEVKASGLSYGQYVAKTEYKVTIERKW